MKKYKTLLLLPVLLLTSCEGLGHSLMQSYIDLHTMPPGIYVPGCIYQSPHQQFYRYNGRHYNMHDPAEAAEYHRVSGF